MAYEEIAEVFKLANDLVDESMTMSECIERAEKKTTEASDEKEKQKWEAITQVLRLRSTG